VATRLLRRAESIAPLRGWLLLAGVYVVAFGLNLARNWGYHFGPDSRFYLAWAYRFGGLSEMDAGKRTYDFLNTYPWFHNFCWYACDTSDPSIKYDWLFRGEEGGLFAQRIVYPLLSAPFVRIFGPAGMLVVPALAYLACVVLVVAFASRIVGPRWAVVAGLGVVVPVSISSYAIYAYTEALAMALLMACVVVLPFGRDATRRDHVLFGVFLTLFAFTRQFHLVVLAGTAVAWLGALIATRRWRNPFAPFLGIAAGLSVVIGLIQSWMSPGYSLLKPFLTISGATSVGDIPRVLPGVISRVVSGEIQVGGKDFGFVMVCLLGAAGIMIGWRSSLGQFAAGVLVGTFVLELVTALPSQNRYWALSVPLLAVLAAGFLARVVGRDWAEPPLDHGDGAAKPMPETAGGPEAWSAVSDPAARTVEPLHSQRSLSLWSILTSSRRHYRPKESQGQ
jgi:hypothetical protein